MYEQFICGICLACHNVGFTLLASHVTTCHGIWVREAQLPYACDADTKSDRLPRV